MFGEPFARLSKAYAGASLQNHVGLGWQATIFAGFQAPAGSFYREKPVSD